MNVALLRSSFEQISPRADDVAERFYASMFAVYPQVRPCSRTSNRPSSARS
ncbi:MAG: hypothetical protein ACYTG2_00870 [Planctomycetota bacterium]